MQRRWHIRAAVAADAPGLQQCMQAAYAVYQDRMGGKSLPPMEADYAAEIRDYPVWVAESDGRIVGGLVMVFAEKHATLANVAVHPDYQGQGLGGGLMKLANDQARANGCVELRLATHTLLTENVALYRHLGWVETDRDSERVQMKKTL